MNNDFINRIKNIAVNKHEHPGEEACRYGSAPYSLHLDNVVEYVKKYIYHIDEDKHDVVICAAYCHDLIEDTDMDINTLRDLTNDDIAELVFFSF